MPVGTFGVCGYAIEGVQGTFVSPSLSIPINSETLKTDTALVSPGVIAGSRDSRRYALRGKAKIQGDIVFDMFADAGSLLIGSALALNAAAGTINPTNNLNSFSVQIDLADLASSQFSGLIISKMMVSVKAGETAKCTITFDGLKEVIGAVQATPTFRTTDPLNWDNCTISTGAQGAATADLDVTSFEFTLDNAPIPFYSLNNTNFPSRLVPGPRKVEGKFTKYFADSTLHAAYLANTTQSLALSILNVGGNGYVFQFPRVNIQAWSAPLKIQDIIQQDIVFWAPLDPTQTPPESIRLIATPIGGMA